MCSSDLRRKTGWAHFQNDHIIHGRNKIEERREGKQVINVEKSEPRTNQREGKQLYATLLRFLERLCPP